jgi:hypothetical protein
VCRKEGREDRGRGTTATKTVAEAARGTGGRGVQKLRFERETTMNTRKYLPTFAELIDRLSIVQLKGIFIAEYRDEYAKEIEDILHDIDVCIGSHEVDRRRPDGGADGISASFIDAEMIRDIVVLAQMNLHIWHNEANFRRGMKDGNNLELTHSLNGIRNLAKNRIQSKMGGRKDYKVDCLAEDAENWKPTGW